MTDNNPTERVAAVLRREFRTALGLKAGDYFPSAVFDRAAAAVIDAMQLTTERRVAQNPNSPMLPIGENWHLETRLVGPWVEGEQ